MVKVDMSQIEGLRRDLMRLSSTALPVANRATLNGAAFAAQKAGREIVAARMVLRNRYTVQSIQVQKADGMDIRKQFAVVGSVAPYMATQETGGTKVKKGTEGVAIPTSYSAGQGEGVRPRTRLPRASNKLQAIKLQNKGINAKNRAQRNAIAVMQAARSGTRFVYLELQRTKGLFRVVGGKRNPNVRMVHDLTRTSVRIPRRQWLEPAVDVAQQRMPALYLDALEFQAKRLGLFKGRA